MKNEAVPLLSRKAGSVVCVEEVSYARLTQKKEWKTELSEVSLVANPGEVWACMGRSGPWTTSLLELMAMQRKDGIFSGRILYDGRVVGRSDPTTTNKNKQQLATLVSGENQLSCVSTLTVREILWVSACLRHSTGWDSLPLVDEIIDLLGLRKCAEVAIGSDTVRGASGGEKRRLAIGLGLVAEPRVVLLDEPTTGLDSSTSVEVMRHVHDSVARTQGRTVAATLHAPSAEVLELCCDKLLLLTTQGRVAYAGPVAKVLDYLAAKPLNLIPHERLANPADFLLAIIAGGDSNLEDSKTRQYPSSQALASAFQISPHGRELSSMVETAANLRKSNDYDDDDITTIKQNITESSGAALRRQISALLWRSLTQFRRSKAIWKTSLFKMFWIGLLYSSTFWNQPKNADGAANLESCFYFSLMFGILGNLRGIVTLFDERKLYEVERANKAYSPLVYWISTSFAQIPWLIFVNTLFSTLVFFTVGGAKVSKSLEVWGWYLLVTQLTNFVGFAWAQMLAAWTSTSQVAMSVWQPGVYVWSQTSGFPIKLPVVSHSNPAYWLMGISFTRWAYEALIVGFFHDGWGSISRSTIFDEYGYPTTMSKWILLVPLVIFVILVRCATYPPLREPRSGLVHTDVDDFRKRVTNAEIVMKKNQTSAQLKTKKVSFAEDVENPLLPSSSSDQTQHLATVSTCVTIDVENVYYSVRLGDRVRPLLRGVSASISPSQMLAVLGPSGAGKSTFLDLISGRKTTGFGAGRVLYNGKAPSAADRHALQCYVMQHDVLIPNLSVSETVQIATMLRLDRPSLTEVHARVAAVVTLLALEHCSSSLIRVLAAGERRLAAVAVEMVHFPAVYYLDEPTSGLDSNMAFSFVKAARRLADRGASLVCTIHQPTVDIFNCFSKLLVVGDGRCIFSGTPNDARNRISELGITGIKNPAEWLLDIAKRPPSSENKNNLPYGDGLMEPIEDGFDLDKGRTAAGSKQSSTEMLLSVFQDYFTLNGLSRQYHHFHAHVLRNALVLANSRSAVIVAIIRNACVAVWYGVVYYNQSDAHSLASVLFFSQQLLPCQIYRRIPQMFAERALLYRELSAGFCGIPPYLAARCFVNALVQIPLVFLYTAFVYPMVGLRGGFFSAHFVFFYAIMFGLALAGYAFSNLIAAITPNQQSALNPYSALFQFCIFMSGYAIPMVKYLLLVLGTKVLLLAGHLKPSFLMNSKVDDDDAESWLKHWDFSSDSPQCVFGIFVLQTAVFHLLALFAMRFISFQRQ